MLKKHFSRSICAVFAVLMIFGNIVCAENGAKELTIFFTGSINGKFTVCNCAKEKLGGILRAASLIESERKACPESILVDAGDFVMPYTRKDIVEAMLECIKLMDYDAVGIGDQELSANSFFDLIKNFKIPFVSANIILVQNESYDYPVDGKIIIKKAGLKIIITSIMNPAVMALYPGKVSKNYILLPAEEIAEKIASENKDCDLVVLLSHGGIEHAKTLAGLGSAPDIIISANSKEMLEEPIEAGSTLIGQSGRQAEHIGKLVLKFDDNNKIVSHDYKLIPVDEKIPENKKIKKILKKINKVNEKSKKRK